MALRIVRFALVASLLILLAGIVFHALDYTLLRTDVLPPRYCRLSVLQPDRISREGFALPLDSWNLADHSRMDDY